MAHDFHKSVMPAEDKVPLMGYPVDELMTTLSGNRLVSLIQLKGVSPETRSDEELIRLCETRNRYFLALGKKEGKNLLVHTYTTKTGIELDTQYTMPLPALQDFVDAYTEPFRNGTFYQVGYGLALVLKYRELDDGIQRMNDLLSLTRTLLAEYDPAIMGLEENEHGALFSQIGRYYSLLINGHEKDVLVSDTRLGDAIIDSVTNFENYDFVENRPNRGGQRFATTFDLRDYPSGGTYPGMWDEANEQQFEFTLVQTFLFEDRNKAKDKFKKHKADLGSVENDSHQIKELEKAIEDITLGDKAFGRYHASLIVYGKTPDQAIENGTKMTSVFTVRDATFVRSTMSNVDTWYTQFPGVTEAMYPMMKSTENLADSFSLHSTPTGKVKGNPIGDGTGLMPVLTANKALYVLNVHDSPPGQNNLGEMLPGHAVFTGQTGVGKTTAEATLLTFLSRFDPLIFGIDYNESLKHLLCALGAEYYTVQLGHFTGVNPFQFHDSPGLRQMLFDLVLCCSGGPDKSNDADQKRIKDSIEAVMAHTNVRNRSMSLLLRNIPEQGENCLRTRLSKWCRLAGEGRVGQYAWVLDSPVNQFDAQTYRRLAFDCTQLLKNNYAEKHPEVMEAFLNTLFYMKREMHEARPGNLLLNVVAEYWAPLSFKSTADAIQEVLQSGRMRGEILIMDTQYPEQALATKYAPAVIQQVITPIWLPNKNAQAKSYAKFGVTGKLFEAVRAMGKLSREMVVQQGHQTVKLKMELGGPLKYWLPLLSATKKNLAVAERIRQHLDTNDPKVWVDAFLVAEAVRQWLNTDDPAVWLPAFDYADNLRQSMNTRDAQRWMPAFQKAWKAIQEHNEMEVSS
ncbi:VirB4 [Pseudomonas syringae pv. pisi str. 1704B]|uniref:VirB4 n=3 Tax=Pseudomonas syringae TaxID=317 RepID=F3GF04_PSESJ|nr:VirB4 [Pseudomonas syringae pv. pisi str. 1704B]RMM26934.1 hypothetical protein ALQ82_200317 [Pseudomonas syringae pv. pisi]